MRHICKILILYSIFLTPAWIYVLDNQLDCKDSCVLRIWKIGNAKPNDHSLGEIYR